jgi:hypothetical protein
MKSSSIAALAANQGAATRASGAMEDRDLAQVVEMNLRGLQVVRDEAASARPGLPAAVVELSQEWRDTDDILLGRIASAPYLLFDIAVHRAAASQGTRSAVAEGAPPGLFGRATGRSFARLLVHFAWHVCSSRPVSAPMTLGLSGAGCAQLRAHGLQHVDALAEGAARWVQLRWADEPEVWRIRIDAARRNDAEALWSSTLSGMQRVAGACQAAAASEA